MDDEDLMKTFEAWAQEESTRIIDAFRHEIRLLTIYKQIQDDYAAVNTVKPLRDATQHLYQPIKSYLSGDLNAMRTASFIKGYYQREYDAIIDIVKNQKVSIFQLDRKTQIRLQKNLESIMSTPNEIIAQALEKSEQELRQLAVEFEKVW